MSKNITLKNLLNTSRNDFKIMSETGNNTIIFMYKQLIYMYNYCTCFFYEVIKIEFDSYPYIGYQIKKFVKQEIPNNFSTYTYFKDKNQNYQRKELMR